MPYHRDDPPDCPEPPECCDDIMDVDDDGNCFCPTCGKVIEAVTDIEPPDDPKDIEGDYLRDAMQEAKDYNFYADDIAYDAARESIR